MRSDDLAAIMHIYMLQCIDMFWGSLLDGQVMFVDLIDLTILDQMDNGLAAVLNATMGRYVFEFYILDRRYLQI